MDLTRLYNLTTPELREEAERLGVADTYAMSRGQLIHAIRDRAGTSRNDGFLGKVFGFAKWALQAAGETSSGGGAPEAEPVSGAAAVSGAAPESASAPESAPAAVSAAAPAAVAVPVAASGSVPVEEATEHVTGPPSRPPAGVFSSSAGLFEEPFPTRTMARILADQGHYKRSLAIYARLLHEEPSDGELCAEAEAVRKEARARRSHAPQ